VSSPPWTPDAVDAASPDELVALNRAYRDLMLGYEPINGEKSVFYARKAIAISRRQGWTNATGDAARHIGQHFYAQELYDSALVYFRESLECVEKMAAGATPPDSSEAYSELTVDDTRSALYGAIGNLYNVMGDIPTAMDYYRKAGAIFDNTAGTRAIPSCITTSAKPWVGEKDYKLALPAYGNPWTMPGRRAIPCWSPMRSKAWAACTWTRAGPGRPCAAWRRRTATTPCTKTKSSASEWKTSIS
jgi:hypothetical protein